MIDLQRLLSPVDAALCVLALGAILLVLYLAWARRRLADLQRADEAVERVLTQDEVEGRQKKLFALLDKNDDGKIEKSEMRGMGGWHHRGGWRHHQGGGQGHDGPNGGDVE